MHLSSECGVKVLPNKALAALAVGQNVCSVELPFDRETRFKAGLGPVLGLVRMKLNMKSSCFLELFKW